MLRRLVLLSRLVLAGGGGSSAGDGRLAVEVAAVAAGRTVAKVGASAAHLRQNMLVFFSHVLSLCFSVSVTSRVSLLSGKRSW